MLIDTSCLSRCGAVWCQLDEKTGVIYIYIFSLKSATLTDIQKGADLLSNKGTFFGCFFFFFDTGTFLNTELHFAIDDDLLALQPLSLLDVVL